MTEKYIAEAIRALKSTTPAPRESIDTDLTEYVVEQSFVDFIHANCPRSVVSPAPREVTVQEAARVLLDIARERYTENARTRVCQPVEPWDRISDDVKKMWLWASCIRALANEEQSDG